MDSAMLVSLASYHRIKGLTIEASNAPRMKRKTRSPAKLLKAARIMQLIPHPKKQIQIQMLTGNFTRAYTDRGWNTSCAK
jgi:hypothetical protein